MSHMIRGPHPRIPGNAKPLSILLPSSIGCFKNLPHLLVRAGGQRRHLAELNKNKNYFKFFCELEKKSRLRELNTTKERISIVLTFFLLLKFLLGLCGKKASDRHYDI